MLPTFVVNASAVFGYASAEIILNLKVLDGTRVIASNRLSVARAISVAFWLNHLEGSGQYTFSAEFDQVPGIPRTYTANGELETWVGGAAVLMGAWAMNGGFSHVDRLRVILVTQ